MARLLGVTVILLFTLVSAACGGAAVPVSPGEAQPPAPGTTHTVPVAGWEEDWNRTVAEAKKEGLVRFYTVSRPATRQEVGKAFKERFGIEVDFVAASAGEIGSKLETEYKRGMYLADAINTGGGTHITVLKPNGIVQSMVPALVLPEVLDTRVWRVGRLPFVDTDNTFFAMVDVFQQFVLYNRDMVKEGEIASLRDVLKPQWRGKITMHDPTVTGTGLTVTVFLARLWGIETAKDFLKQLAEQEPVFSRDSRQVTEWVARGKYSILVSPSPDNVSEFLGVGAPLAYAKIAEGGLLTITTGGLARPSKPAHPNASRLFINWVLTKEGQTSWVKGDRLPSSRLDVPREGIPPEFLAGAGDKFLTQNEEHFVMMGALRPINAEIFAKQLK